MAGLQLSRAGTQSVHLVVSSDGVKDLEVRIGIVRVYLPEPHLALLVEYVSKPARPEDLDMLNASEIILVW